MRRSFSGVGSGGGGVRARANNPSAPQTPRHLGCFRTTLCNSFVGFCRLLRHSCLHIMSRVHSNSLGVVCNHWRECSAPLGPEFEFHSVVEGAPHVVLGGQGLARERVGRVLCSEYGVTVRFFLFRNPFLFGFEEKPIWKPTTLEVCFSMDVSRQLKARGRIK